MKRFFLLFPFALVFANLGFSQIFQNEDELIKLIESGSGFQTALLDDNSSSPDKKRELIVQFRSGAGIEQLIEKTNDALAGVTGFQVKKVLSEKMGIYLLGFENCLDCENLDEFLRLQPDVISASWNRPVEFRDSIPNDPLFGNQWDMERIGLPAVWHVSTGGLTANGDEIVVAVLDKGFDLFHEDLKDNVWQNPAEIPNDGIDNDGNGFVDDINGWNFRDSAPFFPLADHGTWVSGIIGGKGNNGIGMAGTNWNVKMMFLSVVFADEVVSAFDYVLKMRELYHETNGEKGAFIVVTNGSFGIDGVHCSEQPAWGAMYDPLGEAGILSVAATANENWDVDEIGDIPTSCTSEYLIAVTSTDRDDLRVSNAAFGKTSIDLAAPGKTTTTTNTVNRYNEAFGGTSSACPHVAGSIALLYSMPCTGLAALAHEQPHAAARLLRDAILKNADLLPDLRDKTVTGGRLNVFESMKYLHAWCIAKTEERSAGNFRETYIEEKNVIRVYPNPVSDLLTIDYSNEDFTDISVTVFNSLGQKMVLPFSDNTQPFVNQQITIDVTHWPSGAYFINLLDSDKKITKKFVKI